MNDAKTNAAIERAYRIALARADKVRNGNAVLLALIYQADAISDLNVSRAVRKFGEDKLYEAKQDLHRASSEVVRLIS